MVRMNLLHQSIHQHHRPNPITPIQIQARNTPGAGGLLWPSRSARPVELGDSLSNLRLPSCQTVLFTAGGGTFGSRSPSSERIRGGSLALEPSQKERPTTIPRKRMIEDVPDTALFNGKTLTFGEYRSATLVERASIFLASIGVIGWRASLAFRRSRRAWHTVTVAVLAPCLALLVKSVASYLYREIALHPELRSPESLALPKSFFKDIEGLKVHYLRETPTAAGGAAEVNLTTPPTSVLHLNHGFGASALSWESVIPSLSRALGTVVAHDTPGFGLTERAGIRRTENYSLRFNAGITQRLIRDEVQKSSSSSPPVILMGHSMGCITAVTASLDPSLPPKQTTLVMVSPALPAPSKKTNNNKSGRPVPQEAGVSVDGGVCRTGGRFNTGVSRVLGGLKGLAGALAFPLINIARAVRDAMVWTFNWCLLPLLYPVEVLLLRSLVYRGDFWRNALRMAWFDENGVDIDVINRYRWPSVVRHWDRGMVLFLLDRLQLGRGGVAGPRGLLDAVAAKAAQGMKVVVIQGENDKLVTLARAKAIAAAIPNAKLLVVPECGHVPHEEKPQEFLQLLLGQLDHREAQTNKGATGCATD